jgi:membrane glycosyltransferase
MANRTKVLETLDQYFKDKGRIMKSNEYARETDTPIRLQQVRNIFGSWNRVEKLLMAREARSAPEPTTNVNEVIAEANAKALDELKAAQAIREDLEAKVAAEADANAKAEELALAAANPETINAVKAAANAEKTEPAKVEPTKVEATSVKTEKKA